MLQQSRPLLGLPVRVFQVLGQDVHQTGLGPPVGGIGQRPGGEPVGGLGVGLALVKTVAANYEGRAYVESEPGAGATFRFDLPVETTGEPQEAAA